MYTVSSSGVASGTVTIKVTFGVNPPDPAFPLASPHHGGEGQGPRGGQMPDAAMRIAIKAKMPMSIKGIFSASFIGKSN